MVEVRKELVDWLNKNNFIQHAGKPNLFMRVIDNDTIAYVDFRRTEKGHRYYTKGTDMKDDADTIEILLAFKEARNSLFENKLIEVPKKQEIIEPAKPMVIQNDVIGNAALISKQLIDVIEKAKLYTMISGKKYVRVDGWETLGALLHCSSEVINIKEFKDGYWAEAHIINQSGQTISKGVGICLHSEKNWEKRDDYALLSMAQTRALGKAYRLGFSWIMNLAGYEPVSAEEMGEK